MAGTTKTWTPGTNAVMGEFTAELKTALGFLVGALVVNVLFGSKVLFWYMILVLLSMLVLNAAQLNYFLGKVK